MLILRCIVSLQSQIIYFTNAFAQADIISGDPVFIEIPRDFMSDGGQWGVVIGLNKILYGQAEHSCIWYENLKNSFQINFLWQARWIPVCSCLRL